MNSNSHLLSSESLLSPDSNRAPSRLRRLAPSASAILALIAQFGCAASGQIDDASATDDDSTPVDDDDSALGDDDTTPAEDDDTTEKEDCTDADLGLSINCPANNCYSLLWSRPDASSDVYWLDLDSSGDVPPVRLRCDMRVDPLGDPQGWTILDAVRAPQIAGFFTSWQIYPQEDVPLAGPNFYADPSPSCTSWVRWSGVLGALGNSGFRASPDCETILDHGFDEVFKMRGPRYGCNWISGDPKGGDDITLSEAGHISPGCPITACDDDAYNSAPMLGIPDFDGNGVSDGYCVAVTTYPW